jgi:hypothetical protein
MDSSSVGHAAAYRSYATLISRNEALLCVIRSALSAGATFMHSSGRTNSTCSMCIHTSLQLSQSVVEAVFTLTDIGGQS